MSPEAIMAELKNETYPTGEDGQPVIEKCPASDCPAPRPWIMECAGGRTWVTVCDNGHLAFVVKEVGPCAGS